MSQDKINESTSLAKLNPAVAAAAAAGPVELEAEKAAALELLKLGNSMAQTARGAGVSRVTLYRWLKSDPQFGAAYNQWLNELEESGRARLMMLTDKATFAVERALEAGDAKMAMQLLKGMGLIKPSEGPRPTDPADVAKAAELADMKQKCKLLEEERELELQDKSSRFMNEGLDEHLDDEKGGEAFRRIASRTRKGPGVG